MFKLFFLVHRAVFNDTSIAFNGKRLRVYTLHNSKKAVTAD